MSAPQALSAPVHAVRRSSLALIALFAALAVTLLGGVSPAHAEGTVPDKPEDLIYVAEGAEVSPPDMETIASLMNGLNGAHEEKVGIIITDEKTDAQGLADEALPAWGLDESGAVIVITTQDQGVGLAVAKNIEDRVSLEDQDDVVNKVGEGIGQYADWASGVQSGATRLFLYIEDQGMGDGTDHHEGDGHTHEADDPAVEEVPAGEAPDDAYVADEDAPKEEGGVTDTTKIVSGVAIILLAGAGLFLLYRMGRKKAASGNSESDASASEPGNKD